MTRIASFADGFTSASPPTLQTDRQEDYTIANNTIGGALFTLNQAVNKTAFIDYELIRKTGSFSYKQTGTLIATYKTSWTLSEGNYEGDDMIRQSAIVAAKDLRLILNSSSGVLTYDSGNIAGTSYVGTFKINIVRVA